jgi:excisionase family DNA binding protein
VVLTEQEKAERPFTAQEAADFLKVHENTVKRWIKEGRIKAVKIDRGWRIRRSEIERILDGE